MSLTSKLKAWCGESSCSECSSAALLTPWKRKQHKNLSHYLWHTPALSNFSLCIRHCGRVRLYVCVHVYVRLLFDHFHLQYEGQYKVWSITEWPRKQHRAGKAAKGWIDICIQRVWIEVQSLYEKIHTVVNQKYVHQKHVHKRKINKNNLLLIGRQTHKKEETAVTLRECVQNFPSACKLDILHATPCATAHKEETTVKCILRVSLQTSSRHTASDTHINSKRLVTTKRTALPWRLCTESLSPSSSQIGCSRQHTTQTAEVWQNGSVQCTFLQTKNLFREMHLINTGPMCGNLHQHSPYHLTTIHSASIAVLMGRHSIKA